MMWIAGALLLASLLVAALITTWRGAEATHYYSGYRWEDGDVFWGAESLPPPPSSWMPVIADAAWEWSVTWRGFTLHQGIVPEGYDYGLVKYVPFSTWRPRHSGAWAVTEIGLSPIGPGGKRYLVSPAWMLFDSEKQWRLDNRGDFDPVGNLRAVALHEFGHWIMLNGTDDWSIMCGHCVMDEGMKTLSQHDIETVRAVYPRPSGGGK